MAAIHKSGQEHPRQRNMKIQGSKLKTALECMSNNEKPGVGLGIWFNV